MRARYYSPDIKRFINADILAGSISDTMSMNRYAYANANPVSNVDPSGFIAERLNAFYDIVQSSFESIMQFISETFGTATTLESTYKSMTIKTFLADIEHGEKLGKEYDGEFKPIEFIYEKSAQEFFLDDKIGVKINFNKESGVKVSGGILQASIEMANQGTYLEFLAGFDKLGLTLSKDVNWNDYTVGVYDHFYMRPFNMALTAAAVAGVVKLVAMGVEAAGTAGAIIIAKVALPF